jgi:hypothetical protein
MIDEQRMGVSDATTPALTLTQSPRWPDSSSSNVQVTGSGAPRPGRVGLAAASVGDAYNFSGAPAPATQLSLDQPSAVVRPFRM